MLELSVKLGVCSTSTRRRSYSLSHSFHIESELKLGGEHSFHWGHSEDEHE